MIISKQWYESPAEFKNAIKKKRTKITIGMIMLINNWTNLEYYKNSGF